MQPGVLMETSCACCAAAAAGRSSKLRRCFRCSVNAAPRRAAPPSTWVRHLPPNLAKITLCASSCSQYVQTVCSASTDIHVSLQLADFSAGHPCCAMTRTALRLCRRCARRLDGLPRAPGLPGAGGRPRRLGPGSGGAEQRCELSLHHYYSSPVFKLLLGAGHVPGVQTHRSP